MILVAVGTQFPFDRLVETVDRWAATSGTDVVGQIGPSTYKPAHIKAQSFFPPEEFESLLKHADVMIAHCGMGSILSALSLGKPIIVMPRSASRGEHRNDHQFATALSPLGAVWPATVVTESVSDPSNASLSRAN